MGGPHCVVIAKDVKPHPDIDQALLIVLPTVFDFLEGYERSQRCLASVSKPFSSIIDDVCFMQLAPILFPSAHHSSESWRRQCDKSAWRRRWRSWFIVYIMQRRRVRRGALVWPSGSDHQDHLFVPHVLQPDLDPLRLHSIEGKIPVPSFADVKKNGSLPYNGLVPILFAGQVFSAAARGDSYPYPRFANLVLTKGGLQALYQLVFEYDHFLRTEHPGFASSDSKVDGEAASYCNLWDVMQRLLSLIPTEEELVITRQMVEYMSGKSTLMNDHDFIPETMASDDTSVHFIF